MNVGVVERTAFVLQQFIHVVDEWRRRAQHVDVVPVDVLRHVDLVPELSKVRHVQRHPLVRDHRADVDDGLRQALLVHGDADQQVDQQVVRLVELEQRRVVRRVDTLVHVQNPHSPSNRGLMVTITVITTTT